MDSRQAYSDDPRLPCQYGRKCYQKNPNHHTKYKHPPDPKRKNEYLSPDANSKRKKLNNDYVNEESKINNINKKDDTLDGISSELSVEDSNPKQGIFSNDVSDSESENESKDLDIESKKDDSVHTSDHSSTQNVITKHPKSICVHKMGHNNTHSRDYIKSKFLFEMPEDFYKFFELCERLNSKDPLEALQSIGLTLVGPFDVICGKFCGIEMDSNDYLVHWRYYYDPPNFQTVLKGSDKSGYHIGYFRDYPNEDPVFLAENCGLKDGVLTVIGDNLFGAVSSYIEDCQKTCDPFSKVKFNRMQKMIQEEASKLGYNLSRKTEKITKRNNKVLTRTFNKVGLVVPYERKTQLGYRKLAMTEKALDSLLTKIDKAGDKERAKFLAELQSEILTWTNIACDECDFGTGIELGLDILCHGVDLNHTISLLLCSNYSQLKWTSFAKIADAHMSKRRKGCNLSVL